MTLQLYFISISSPDSNEPVIKINYMLFVLIFINTVLGIASGYIFL